MTRVIVAPDSFKESLASPEVADAIAKGVRRVLPEAEIFICPMADGGEGLSDCLLAALGGEKYFLVVTGPLGQPVTAAWVALDNLTSVIEMAAASGLALVPRLARNPLQATSFGTGELMRAALDAGCRRIIVGVGGSATSDGGTGMAQALGVRFLDAGGRPLPAGVPALLNLAGIDMSGLHPALAEAEVVAACDVSNPLYGPSGAAYVYAPQKGAGPDQVALLDAALAWLAEVAAADLGKDLACYPGAGGGGGMGYGLMMFAGASLVPGLDLVCRLTGFDELLAAGADLVITGEGQINEQTLYGKVPVGIASRAKKHGIPVLALAGSVALPAQAAAQHGIDAMASIAPGPITLDECIARTPELLADAAERALRLICLFRRL
ncbi:MAG: glycerate kinase [Dethiobacter sp.]|jgi:glycerate kinase|nr:glycerate kinase [Dethiobacter sp.]MBS3900954.1 glycerate kinase [Dethiobacter sp.]MBS3988549.1 glycerate kinase [Dethiobacter sp.]